MLSKASSFLVSLGPISTNSILTVAFLGWKGLFSLLVKKVNLEEISLSKLTMLLRVTAKILIQVLFEYKECILFMMLSQLNTLNRIPLSRSRK